MANTMLGLSEVRRGDEPMDATPRDHIWPQWMVNGTTGEKKILAGPTDGWMTKDEYRVGLTKRPPSDDEALKAERATLFIIARAMGLKVFAGIKTEDLRAKIAEAKAA